MENKPTSNKPNRRKIIIAIVVFIVFIAGIYRFVVSSDMNEENSDWVNKIIIGTKTYEKWDQRERTISRCTYKSDPVYYITY
ncbi:MAG: hypothetical protein ACD_34C00112G0003, partial [uncultured bacterium]